MFNSQGYIENYENAPIIFRQNGGESARFDASKNLLVGTTSLAAIDNTPSTVGIGLKPSGTIMQSVANGGNAFEFRINGTGVVGSISCSGSNTAYNTSSDARLKDVTGEARGLEVINELNPVAYNWKADGNADEGLIAQEVMDIVPNAVSGSEEDMYQMDYSKLVVHLVAGMKEQQELITTLQAEVALLKEK